MTRGRIAAAVLGAIILLAGVGLTGYRVFAPHESLTRPTTPYPADVVVIDEHPFTELRAAPLIVDGRLRVYAEQRRVWADGPVGARQEKTPYWAFRRWPAQVVGVVAVARPDSSLVITQWSDGDLVALDAKAGVVAWRAHADVGTTAYDGRRTGASVVYQPRSLVTVRTTRGGVLLVTAAGTVTALDAATGATLWRHAAAGGCEPDLWTGAGLVVEPRCDGTGVTYLDPLSGAPRGSWTGHQAEPSLCALGRTECRLLTAQGKAWLFGPGGHLTAVPPIGAGAIVAGDRVIQQTATGVSARRLTDGAPLWTHIGPGRLVGADSVGVYLLDADDTVFGLSPLDGTLRLLGCASTEVDQHWRVGHVYTTGTSFIAMERLNDQPPSANDQLYYFGPKPVALVELYPKAKMPVWSNAWAACAGQLSGPVRPKN